MRDFSAFSRAVFCSSVVFPYLSGLADDRLTKKVQTTSNLGSQNSARPLFEGETTLCCWYWRFVTARNSKGIRNVLSFNVFEPAFMVDVRLPLSLIYLATPNESPPSPPSPSDNKRIPPHSSDGFWAHRVHGSSAPTPRAPYRRGGGLSPDRSAPGGLRGAR
jgi:hypothetical protein